MVLSKSEQETIQRCWFLTGATASGKSVLSIQLAAKLNAEIISLDSMAIYRGMDLGTAKPTANARQQVPHHLIDIVSPDQDYSVSQFRGAALEAIEQIRNRGHEVLLVGGTALYLQALLKGIFDGPPADWEFRKQVEQQAKELGQEALFARLRDVDPLSAEKLHLNDTRRIVRALEVMHLTGQPISHVQKEFDRGMEAEQCRVFWLHRDRKQLHLRIESRVRSMFQDGLVGEVEGLLEKYGSLSRSATQAVGYKEVIDHLENKMDLEETLQRVIIHTRKFARQQETWFRNLRETRQIEIDDDTETDAVVEEILAAGKVVQSV